MLSTLLLVAASQVGPLPFMRSPDIFGDTVVYTTEGDLWLGDLDTNKASRLTRDVGTEFDAKFSPDGTLIAYTGELDGIREVYVMPVAGGAPKRLTYLNDFAEVVDWKDSRTIVFRGRAYPNVPTLFAVPAAGGVHERLPLEFASVASFAPDGNRFVFNRFNRFGNAWFRYSGGMKNDLWMGNLSGLGFERIYEGKASAEFPTWTASGICFVTYDGNNYTVNRVDGSGKNLRRLAGPYDNEVRYLQTDGSRLIYEKGMEVEICGADGSVRPVRFEMRSDLLHTRPFLAPAEATVFHSSLGPTGKRVLVETRGQIVSLPVKDGDARVVLAKDGVRYRYPVYSPDGKKIAYFSDEKGEMHLYVCDADGANARQLTSESKVQLRRVQWSPDSKLLAVTDNFMRLRLVDAASGKVTDVYTGSSWGWDGPPFDFSPDSKWVVFQATDFFTGVRSLELYDIAGGKKHVVSRGTADDIAPVFSRDGKYIAFLSHRNIAPGWDPIQNQINVANDVKVYLLALSADTPSPLSAKAAEEGADVKEEPKGPMRVDVEGLYGRFVELPFPPADYSQVVMADDRVIVRNSDGAMSFYDLKAKRLGKVTDGAPLVQISADGKSLLLGSGAGMRVVAATAEDAPRTAGAVGFAGLQIRIEPTSEWRNMFWDAWRHIRDYFYVANMHGNDWDAVGRKYEKLLPSVRSRDELTQILRWMLAELSVSHAFFGAGDVRSLLRPARPSFLGIDVDADPSGYLKITRILRGGDFVEAERSPMAAPGVNVREGEFLIEVGGRPAKVGQGWQEALLGRAGQAVAVKVNSRPTPEGARTVLVRPVESEVSMRYRQWVQDRREYVEKASGGKIAYLHMRAMTLGDYSDFVRQYFPQRGKEALIVDIRFNTGGSVSDRVINVLKQKLVGWFNLRNSQTPWTRQGDFFPGPMACLINEFNYSNGEEFPHAWRAWGLGPIIGRRTRGGEVGSDPGWPMADGGTISVPNYGMFTEKDGWIIEGPGVSPDIDVLSDPNTWARGKDPQLDRAISMMLESLRKNPVKRPVVPKDPVRTGGGG